MSQHIQRRIPLEATRTDDLFLCKGAEHAGDNLESGIFVVFLQAVIFRDFFSGYGQYDGKVMGPNDVLSHIEFSCDFFFAAKLHYKILVPCLALSDRSV